jgi:hypothetical protein
MLTLKALSICVESTMDPRCPIYDGSQAGMRTIILLYCIGGFGFDQYIYCNISDVQYIVLQYLWPSINLLQYMRPTIYCIAICATKQYIYCNTCDKQYIVLQYLRQAIYCIAISSAINIFIAISATTNILYCNISCQQYIYCNICGHQYIVLQYLQSTMLFALYIDK